MSGVNYYGQEPFYFGVERRPEGKFLSWSWFHEIRPPHRWGRGIRVRFGDRAFHVGIVIRRKRPVVHDIERTPEEIGKWVYD